MAINFILLKLTEYHIYLFKGGGGGVKLFTRKADINICEKIYIRPFNGQIKVVLF